MKTIDLIQEIQRLPLSKRFFVLEQTLKSIKNEEIRLQLISNSDETDDLSLFTLAANEKSLAEDWMSAEDNRWDKVL